MRREAFLAVMGIVGVLFGLSFILVPEMTLRMYGVPTEAHNLMESRYFGAALFGFSLVTFLARDTQDAIAVRALLLAGAISNLIGAVISATAAASGLQNNMAWSSVVIYGVFAACCGYFLAAQPKAASGAQPA